MNDQTLFIAMGAMALVTGLCRIVPFLIPRHSRLGTILSGDHPTIRIVGPAVLVGLTVATFGQPLLSQPSWGNVLSYGIGGVATAAGLRATGSVGLAVIAGIIAYGCSSYGVAFYGS
ncbi:AzlD domain-containing protein [Salinisphaera sp. SWV1]|uniref:AzlD domain-containing protein n=1 Tax=Salinisphaera sp. SWV1 TaxID=3454139 RepID=UPI003F84F215